MNVTEIKTTEFCGGLLHSVFRGHSQLIHSGVWAQATTLVVIMLSITGPAAERPDWGSGGSFRHKLPSDHELWVLDLHV